MLREEVSFKTLIPSSLLVLDGLPNNGEEGKYVSSDSGLRLLDVRILAA
jgi:hypothetical protein